MKRLLLLALFGFLMSSCGARLTKMTDKQKSERLATERGRVSELTQPVAKTQSYIMISQILLDFAGGAARDGDITGMSSLLDQYVITIRAARDTMLNSDRDPLRRPAGYKELELALRDQIRRLQDMGVSLSSRERAAVTTALEVANAVHEQIFRRLFPQTSGQIFS